MFVLKSESYNNGYQQIKIKCYIHTWITQRIYLSISNHAILMKKYDDLKYLFLRTVKWMQFQKELLWKIVGAIILFS